MKRNAKMIILLAAVMTVACNVSTDNNKSLDYDSLDVNFSASISGATWEVNDVIGVVATCTRNDETGVAMSTNSPASFAPTAGGANSFLISKTEEDNIVALKGDHNYLFYAFTPFKGGSTDLGRLPADIPAAITFGEDIQQLYVAKKSTTNVIAPVNLNFSTPSCLVRLAVPDDIVNPDGGTVLKSMTVEPADESAFEGAIAYNASYSLLTDEATVIKGSESKKITVNFPESGLQMEKGYTTVTFLMAPFTVPEGAFQLVFTDISGKTNTIPFLNKNIGAEFPAGSLIEQTMGSSSDGIVPCFSPVEWEIGGGKSDLWQIYENISTSKKLGIFNYETQPLWRPTNYSGAAGGKYNDEHIWTSSQPMATIQYFYSDSHPNPSKIIIESNTFQQYNYSSPCIKGLWTGDYLEIKIPVKKFEANTEVSLSFPAYGRGAPIFWDIEYLDGETWKILDKTDKSSPDGQFTMKATAAIAHGNSIKTWDGIPMNINIPFTEAIPSGYLQIRFKVVDGRYITNNASSANNNVCKQIEGPLFDGTSLFAFVNISNMYKTIKVEW